MVEIYLLICIALLQVLTLIWLFAAGNKPLPEPPAKEEKRAPRSKKDPMDEGFENIMQYSVRGHTGFEPSAFGDE